ncbi:MAG TPA: hypothetical protein VOA80_23985 [Thermoanaerobaculia bacterium]|nr:hypothetical protein [Thermoanaerobaculia bacterium]
MSISRVAQCGLAVCLLMFAAALAAEPLTGKTGSARGDEWQSSWLNLRPPMTFKKGERLLIKVQGSAEKVLVRLLPKDSPEDSADGVEGGSRPVPASHVLVVTLENDHPDVKQISVHASKEAWGTSLGANNGNIQVISIERRMH